MQYTPANCFNNFVQSEVEARKAGDENPKSIVVAETLKLLANNSYSSQTIDWSPHRLTKFLRGGKTHEAIKTKKFKPLGFINDQMFEVELFKSEIEHKKPIKIGSFILQYAKLRMLDLYYKFLTNISTLQNLNTWRWVQICSI